AGHGPLPPSFLRAHLPRGLGERALRPRPGPVVDRGLHVGLVAHVRDHPLRLPRLSPRHGALRDPLLRGNGARALPKRTRGSVTGRRSLVLVLILIAGPPACTGLRTRYLLRSPLAVDELEHVHAAWLVSKGQTPYVDFFEHHPPLFYFTLAPVVHRVA